MSDKATNAMTKVSKGRGNAIRGLARDEGGAVAVMLALMLGAMLGTLALAMELGRAWNLETELQHAADACALAGVTQLDGSDGARARAIEACTNAASKLVENEQTFASDGLGDVVTFDTNTAVSSSGGADDGKMLNQDIRFYISLPISDAVEATSDAEANYIEANVAPRRVDFVFAALSGAVTSTSPRARAVSGWTSFYCDSPAMFMCNPAEPEEGNIDEPFDIEQSCTDVGNGPSCVGRTINMKTHGGGGNNKLGPGDWGYLSLQVFNPDTGETETVTGANELKEFLASVEFNNVCTGNQLTTEPGNMTSLDRFINTRLDLYWDSGDMDEPNRQPAPQSLKGLVPHPTEPDGDGTWDAQTHGCRFNPATDGDTGAAFKRPQDNYSVDAGGNPVQVQDGLRDMYLGPGRHRFVDADGDGMIDPHPISEGIDPPILGLMDPPIRTMAFPNDYCAYLSADVDPSVSTVDLGVEGCRPREGGTQMGSGQWDAQTYLDVFHAGMTVDQMECPFVAGDPFSPCADLPNVEGEAPDGKLSRWELYKWEKQRDPSGASPPVAYPNMPHKGKPQCYKAPDQEMGADYVLPESPADSNTEDRRILIMAVVNCVGWDVKGRSDMERTQPDGHIAVFITEPMGYSDADTLYGEIVDPRGLGIGEEELDPQLVRERILLIE